MSQLIRKLSNTSKTSFEPLGFRTTGQRQSAKILVVAEVTEELINAVKVSADAILFNSIPNNLQEKPSLPWGVRLSGEETDIDAVTTNGWDFTVFLAKTPVGLFHEPELGKILTLDVASETAYLRAADESPADAFLLNLGEPQISRLTWHQIILLKRAAGLINKPLLVHIDLEITMEDILALWTANISGVVISIRDKEDVRMARGLSTLLQETRLPSRRREFPSLITVPEISPLSSEEEEPGEEPQ